MTATWHIARLTLLEARRRRTFVTGVLLSALFIGGIVTLTAMAERASANAPQPAVAEPTPPGASNATPPSSNHSPTNPDDRPDSAQSRRERRRHRFEHQMATNAIRTGGMWVIRTFATLMAIVLAAGSVAPEKESGVLHTIVTKPVSRASVLAGKWIGLNLLLFVYLLTMGVLLVLALVAHSGDVPWDVIRASAVSFLFPLLFVTLGVLFSTWTSVWVGLGAGLCAWIVGAQEYGFVRIIAGALRGIGNDAAAEVLDAAGHIAGYVVPSGRIGLWVDRMGGSTRFMLTPPIIEKPTASLWDLGYIALYVAVAFALASWRFRRQDL
jgi:ABC-type transport system involved in multi-copper enzyme maturation permease subunit